MLFSKSVKPLLLVIFTLSSICEASFDYCSKKLCPHGKHIACGHDGKFGPSCPKVVELISMDNYKKQIVDKHNELRGKFAAGNFKGFKGAKRMIEMVKLENEIISRFMKK